MLNRSVLLVALAAVCALASPVVAQDEMTCADCHDEVAAGMVHQISSRLPNRWVQAHIQGAF